MEKTKCQQEYEKYKPDYDSALAAGADLACKGEHLWIQYPYHTNKNSEHFQPWAEKWKQH